MQLNLTLADNAALRRNRDLDVSDLRYVEGEMWFLNVRVAGGGVEESVLTRVEKR